MESPQIELDKAMEKLLKELKKAGKDQNTLIVMSADYYPYVLPDKVYDELTGHKFEKNFEKYKNCFIIYSPTIKEPIMVDKLGSSLDILPTLSNLMDIEYDSCLLMGKDIFSEHESLVIFKDHSFMTERVKYNSVTDKATWINGYEEDKEYLKNMIKIVQQKFKYSTLILEKDYYKYIKYDNSEYGT